jgi:hypothetical protein
MCLHVSPFHSGSLLFLRIQPQVIRAELIHRDHPDSPFSLPSGASTSAADRYAASVSRQKARVARRLGAGVEFQSTISSGNPYEQAEYVTTLYFGTPVQRFVLIVDTGSDLVWVQCQPCKSPYPCYNETDPFFNPSASSSYSPVPCGNLTQCDPRLVSYNNDSQHSISISSHIQYSEESFGVRTKSVNVT